MLIPGSGGSKASQSRRFGTIRLLSSLSRLCRVYLGLVAFSLAGSLLSKLTGLQPGPIAPIAAALTIGVGFVAVFHEIWSLNKAAAYWMLPLALVLSAGIELVGLTTGFPFGRYTYTDRWQPTVVVGHLFFPVLLPFAWLLVVGSATVICARKRYYALWAAGLATLIDFGMEPVMTGPLRYWVWLKHGPLPGGAALLNPVGWFVTALAVSALLSRLKVESSFTAKVVLGGHLILTFGIGAIAMIPR